jgi:hypothetical protein
MASGQARAETLKQDEVHPAGEKRDAPEGAPTTADFGRVKLPKPTGLQAEEANYTTGGTIPANMVSSPGGFVPLSAVADREAALERTLTSSGRNPDTRALSEDEIEGLSGAEARAISAQRGYKPPDLAGSRTQRRFLIEEQSKDQRFTNEKRGLTGKVLK